MKTLEKCNDSSPMLLYRILSEQIIPIFFTGPSNLYNALKDKVGTFFLSIQVFTIELTFTKLDKNVNIYYVNKLCPLVYKTARLMLNDNISYITFVQVISIMLKMQDWGYSIYRSMMLRKYNNDFVSVL